MFVGGALIADNAPKNAIVKGLTLPTPACMMPQECLGAGHEAKPRKNFITMWYITCMYLIIKPIKPTVG